MQFEDLDKKIREAAEQHHPAYDEKAWTKMQKLLNSHLPQARTDKRRGIILLALLLLVGGGTLFFIFRSNNTGAPKQVSSQSQSQSQSQPVATGSEKSSVPVTDTKTADNQNLPVQTTGSTPSNSSDANSSISNSKLKKENFVAFNVDQSPAIRKQKNDQKKTNANKSVIVKDEEAVVTVDPASVATNKKQQDVKNDNVVKNEEVVKTTDTKTENKVENKEVVKEAEKQEQKQSETTPTTAAKKKLKKSNNAFEFTVSAGPDVSKAGSSSMGKLTLAYGAGVSYTVGRFTLRSGIYAARKVYAAKPRDYKLAYAPPNTELASVDANCYVMEVPIKLSYNFVQKKNSSIFASAGVSSYFMKSEKYMYNYKSTYPPYPNYPWPYSVKNENSHLFAGLELSAGFTLRLNNSLSLTAEPYVGIPLHGVGVGDVRLANGGVLFSLGIRPFAGSAKKK